MNTTDGNLIWLCQFFQLRDTLITIWWMQMMACQNLCRINHTGTSGKSNLAKLRVISRPCMVIYFIRHPHGANPLRDFLRVIGMLLQALETISTHISTIQDCAYIEEKTAHPIGRTWWTGFFGLLGYEKSKVFTATANIDHAKRELVLNLRSNRS